jgi:hypothetical protein
MPVMPQTVLLRSDLSPAFESKSALAGELRSDVRRTWVRLGKRERRDPPAAEARRGERLVSQITRPNTFAQWSYVVSARHPKSLASSLTKSIKSKAKL